MSLTEEPEEFLLEARLDPGLCSPWVLQGSGKGVPGGESSDPFVYEGGEGKDIWAGEEIGGEGSPTIEVTI